MDYLSKHKMIEPESIDFVCRLLHDMGYRAEQLDGDAVGSAASGFKFIVQLYRESIQFRCAMQIEGEPNSWLDFTNSFNKDLRFAKIYLSDDNDLLVETDCWIDYEEPIKSNEFRRALELWELSLAAFKERLRDHDAPQTLESEDAG